MVVCGALFDTRFSPNARARSRRGDGGRRRSGDASAREGRPCSRPPAIDCTSRYLAQKKVLLGKALKALPNMRRRELTARRSLPRSSIVWVQEKPV